MVLFLITARGQSRTFQQFIIYIYKMITITKSYSAIFGALGRSNGKLCESVTCQ